VLLFALAFSDPRPLPRVLLVEDHADTRQMYAEFLRLSFEVFEARTGAEAMSLVDQQKPDVIVTDISLPGMSGLDFATQVRAANQQIPIVCVSGYGGEEFEHQARKAGCNRTLVKPCLPDELARTITELLSEPGDRSRS
jgi:CheY-like chemotaxis protein